MTDTLTTNVILLDSFRFHLFFALFIIINYSCMVEKVCGPGNPRPVVSLLYRVQ
ncbi:hypothetical protein K450DRAFT_260163 [Umbelopsis ramanniana AG]|uniref:Uncharacterized protein n=1 Tax=Umbelopsis ramanniana AG TaxID=1314678 RepID=A0AAD5E2M9_UMBRA|nr:uncharacterized protein K450DRAFT_260163 [Umbelopsis ramanniana AG]KAI8575782.1 hypothetical protein K450DRAFT_260163 [Umbelopsis ramanniana AG]